MPYSVSTFDDHVANVFRLIRPGTALDIGPGAGKYGKMIRNVAAIYGFTCETVACEIDESYIKEFELEQIYDRVLCMDACKLIQTPRIRFDVCVIGDCIEHLPKSRAIDLIEFLIYRSSLIVAVIPIDSVQDDWEGHAAEAHVSIWSELDFRGYNAVTMVSESSPKMLIAFINGLGGSGTSITGVDNESIQIRYALK